MEQLIQEWRASLPKFREMTEKFYAKEVSIKEYKGFSGGYGSYAQKGGEASMLRLRMPGGRLTKETEIYHRYGRTVSCGQSTFYDLPGSTAA